VEKETGKKLKPIYGCEVYFTTDDTLARDGKPKLYHLLLLAKTTEGYHNLLKLVSESHVDNFYYKPRTTYEMLQKYSAGIIATSACVAGIIPRLLDNRQFDDAVEWARKLAAVYEPGDFYIELQDQGIVTDSGMTQHDLNVQLTEVAKRVGLKTVATNDFHYLNREDASKQDLMLCIGTGSKLDDANRMRFANDEFYMKTEEEMREALTNLVDVIDRYDSGSPLWWHCGAKGVMPLKNAKAALAAPPRNCDRYATPDAAERAFDDYCHDRRENPTEVCRRKSCRDCQREWLYAAAKEQVVVDA
jgi:DNA polymerase-3 subunit alpha